MASRHPPRVMLLGSAGDFSAVVLRALLESRTPVCAVVSPGAPAEAATARLPAIPVAGPDALSAQAATAGIPHERVGGLGDGAARERLAHHRPDVIVTACFPLVLPGWALALPPQGCLNLHPSVLPAYRGPAPLFWQMRAGEQRTGVTVHWMSGAVDAGDIVASSSIPLAAGDTAAAVNLRLAHLGAELVCEVLMALGRGETPCAQPQDEAAASYFPWPQTSDFELTTAWPAERAFRFIRGTRAWGRPYRIRGRGFALTVRSARAFQAETDLEAPLREGSGGLDVRFHPGVLQVAAGDVLERKGGEQP